MREVYPYIHITKQDFAEVSIVRKRLAVNTQQLFRPLKILPISIMLGVDSLMYCVFSSFE